MPKINLTSEQIRERGWNIVAKEEKGGVFKNASGKKIVIGPLVADGNFSSVSRPKLSSTIKFASGAETLPETWSWRPDQIDPRYDTGARLDAKKNISPILNQALCGSCWAFALASCISDCFIVSGKYLQLPSTAGSLPTSPVSPTSIMACIRDQYSKGCSGGNPGYAAELIQQKGVTSSACLDYSFILNNKYFNGDSTGHFSNSVEMANAMNEALPNCGCIDPLESRKKFTITDVHTLPASESGESTTSEQSLRNTWNLVRRWIWENGSVIGCYQIYDNFFAKTGFRETNGVYFEDYPYEGRGKETAGFHAVRILGWGVEKNCPLPKGGKADVPYWMVANSWSNEWADNGYFKMARYPYNKISQFDTLIETENGGEFGGFILFKAGEVVDSSTTQVSSQFRNSVNPERSSAGFYKSEVLVTTTAPVSPPNQEFTEDSGESIINKIVGGDLTSLKRKRFSKKTFIVAFLIISLIMFIIYKPNIFSRSEIVSSPYRGSSGGAFKSFGMSNYKKF